MKITAVLYRESPLPHPLGAVSAVALRPIKRMNVLVPISAISARTAYGVATVTIIHDHYDFLGLR